MIQMNSDLQLIGRLHVVVVDENISDEALFLRREGGRSLYGARLNDHLQQTVRTPGPVPHLRRHRTWQEDEWTIFFFPHSVIFCLPDSSHGSHHYISTSHCLSYPTSLHWREILLPQETQTRFPFLSFADLFRYIVRFAEFLPHSLPLSRKL